MLDINLFREEKGGNPEIIRESQRRRFKPVELVDEVIALDQEWRTTKFELDQVNKAFNKLNKEIALKRKAKEDATELQEKSKELKKEVEAATQKEKDAAEKRDKAIGPIGNLVHDSVPVNNNEDFNEVVKTFGTPRTDAKYNHVDLVSLLGIANLEDGAAVAGGRGYYLMNYGVLLNQALINYGMQFLSRRGYCPIHTPFFMRKNIMAECAQLADFDEQLYKVSGEGEDKYLIATSEQTISSMHRNKWYEAKDLPIKYAGFSTCFRKEAGSHGRDTLGIFRVHQFEKIEQFCLTSPFGDESWKVMDEMIKNSEDFYQSLEIPYQVVNIVSGELNDAAAKKFDLEASFPASKAFRELVSCSNCTDYQARRLEVRMRTSKGAIDNNKVYVHMLNSTLSATERTLCCLLENFQTPDGVRVPEALQPFMMGVKFMPFLNELDKKGRLQPRKLRVYDPLFGCQDMYRVWFSGDASTGIKKSVDYLFKNLKCQQASQEESPEEAKSSEATLAYHDKVVTGALSVLKFICEEEKSPLYPSKEDERLQVDSVLDWYMDMSNGGKTVDLEKLKGVALPQLEQWLDGKKNLAGKFVTVADVVFCGELMEAIKADKTILDDFKLTSKWFKAVGNKKMW